MAASSTKNSPSKPTSVISNISHLNSVRLDDNNYLLWGSQFLPVIGGSFPFPEQQVKDTNGMPVENPKYDEWYRQEKLLLSWMNATLIENVLDVTIGHGTSRLVWLTLEHHFSSFSSSHILQLKFDFQRVEKKLDSMTTYLVY